jgi:hypothetical protein
MGNVAYLPVRAQNSFNDLQTLDLPHTDQKLSVEVELVPADTAPSLLAGNTNVAKVHIGGKEFFAVVGKTVIDPNG